MFATAATPSNTTLVDRVGDGATPEMLWVDGTVSTVALAAGTYGFKASVIDVAGNWSAAGPAANVTVPVP